MSEAKNIDNITLKKHYTNLINKIKTDKLFKKYDEILIKEYFCKIYDLSQTENILNISTITLTLQNIKDIIQDFIKNKPTKIRIHNLLKISNLDYYRYSNVISDDILLNIGEKIQIVSRETKSISIDFYVLRILDNFISHLKNPNFKNTYNSIRKDIFRKLLRFDYKQNKNEIKANYFYWIKRILKAFIDDEVSVYDFMDLNKKLLFLLPNNIDLDWEIIHEVSYLCFQPRFCNSFALRKFKRYLIKQAKNKYDKKIINQNTVLNILFDTLSQQYPSKESFYYLFDVIKILSKKSFNDKYFCLDLCKYIIYRDERQNIFCYRFIRDTFLRMLDDIIKEDDFLEIKEEEICLVFFILNNKNFYYLYGKKLFNYLTVLIKRAELDENILIRSHLKKYYDVLNFIKSEDFFNKKVIYS